MSALDGSKIDRVLTAAVESGAVPHVAAIVANADGTIYEGAAGVQIAGENDTPVSTSTQFRIMSMTKMVCTAVALQQVEQGNLDLDAPVAQYCPEFADLQVLDGWDGGQPETGFRPHAGTKRASVVFTMPVADGRSRRLIGAMLLSVAIDGGVIAALRANRWQFGQ